MLANEIINRLILLAKGKSELKYDDIFEAKFIKSIPEKEARTIFKSIIDTAGLPATVTAITMPSPTTADARIQFEKND